MIVSKCAKNKMCIQYYIISIVAPNVKHSDEFSHGSMCVTFYGYDRKFYHENCISRLLLPKQISEVLGDFFQMFPNIP